VASLKDRQFWITIFYEGPWERLSTFLLGVRRDGREEFRWIIGCDPKGWKKVLDSLANWADEHDQRWRFKYAVQNRNPPKFWSRRVSHESGRRLQDTALSRKAS
jgi:hypothetical protein